MSRLDGELEPQVGLIELMRARDLSYTQIADAVGVTRSSVSLWARGLRRPTAEQATRVSETLAAPFDAVWTYQRETNGGAS